MTGGVGEPGKEALVIDRVKCFESLWSAPTTARVDLRSLPSQAALGHQIVLSFILLNLS